MNATRKAQTNKDKAESTQTDDSDASSDASNSSNSSDPNTERRSFYYDSHDLGEVNEQKTTKTQLKWMYKRAKLHFLQALEYKDDPYRWAIVGEMKKCDVGESDED